MTIRTRWQVWLGGAALLALLGMLGPGAGCADRGALEAAPRVMPGAQTPYVAALGNLQLGRTLSPNNARLARFFFGAEPDAPLGLIKPTAVAALGSEIAISDGALRSVLRWRSADRPTLEPFPEISNWPQDIAALSDGGLLVADPGGVVLRVSAAGQVFQRFTAAAPFRPAGAALVGDAVWVSDAAQHRIAVFDAASGTLRRTIGRRGSGPGEFGFPLAMAVTPRGEVCVVDMLNARVQVLSAAGEWVRDIGGPGDRVGLFGRPRGVAVGPDGVVFVSDAASQRVHAFAPDGCPLLAFGGSDDGARALIMPAGVCIVTQSVVTEFSTPREFQTAYTVLVAEQISYPGVRAYAWSGERRRADEGAPKIHRVASIVENPHWNAQRCSACHSQDGAAMLPIAVGAVDAKCVSCHDGKQATDEAHPVGWPATGPRTRAPKGWPLVDGRIGCVTCHDIQRHCDTGAQRPDENGMMLRGFDARNPYSTCTNCHESDPASMNPHRMRSADMSWTTTSCVFCHTSAPQLTGGGWQFAPELRESPQVLCQNCHTMHADPAPQGHLGLAVSREVQARLLARPARVLPLWEGKITCATCHNPHADQPQPAELFRFAAAADHSTAPADAGKALRDERPGLCLQCHPK